MSGEASSGECFAAGDASAAKRDDDASEMSVEALRWTSRPSFLPTVSTQDDSGTAPPAAAVSMFRPGMDAAIGKALDVRATLERFLCVAVLGDAGHEGMDEEEFDGARGGVDVWIGGMEMGEKS